MHVILVSMGTDGDVFPFIGVGARLRGRGHQVTLAANEHFQATAARHGLGFRALVSNEETRQLLANPDVWHPVKSSLHGCRWVAPMIQRQHAIVTELVREPGSVLVAYPPVFAARLVHETTHCPLANLVAIPWLILSVHAPPRLPSGLNLPPNTPRLLVKTYWRVLEMVADILIGRRLNQVRRSLGLHPIRRCVRWSFSPKLTIGLFPEWYAPAQPDWPPNTKLAGFSLFDDGDGSGLSEKVLKFCQGGPPPIAFAFGSGNMHCLESFKKAADVCSRLKVRALFLSKFPGQLPESLPGTILPCAYAPFRQLFPHCAAVVHHGGLGTTAQALAAGKPQLILPMAWDQPDNAARVRRLGAGLSLKPNCSRGQLENSLAQLLSPEAKAQCGSLAARIGNTDPLELAADWIENFARSN